MCVISGSRYPVETWISEFSGVGDSETADGSVGVTQANMNKASRIELNFPTLSISEFSLWSGSRPAAVSGALRVWPAWGTPLGLTMLAHS